MGKTQLPSYRELVHSGQLEADPAQFAAAKALRQVARELKRWSPGGGLLAGLFGGRRGEAPRGLYIRGPVGSGKSMLMDLFFSRVGFGPKKRLHFHEFMAMVHDRIGEARRTTPGDPIPQVGRAIAGEARLLCFDEFHVTDIADAMIIGRLFKAMFDDGVVVIATSNVPPSGLYAGGLNRALFLPFIEMLETRMMVHELSAAKDFRLAKLAGREVYFTPADRAAEVEMRAVFERITGVRRGEPANLGAQGEKAAGA